MSNHYVDNKILYQELVQFRKLVNNANKQKLPRPRIPEYVGHCLLLIANRLATKSCFQNYSYKDEMVSDAVENCLQYIDNFDPDRFNNPFAYFTQIIYFAFIRRISREKKQTYIKQKLMEQMVIDELISPGEVDLNNEKMHDIVNKFENKESNNDKPKHTKRKSTTKSARNNRRVAKNSK